MTRDDPTARHAYARAHRAVIALQARLDEQPPGDDEAPAWIQMIRGELDQMWLVLGDLAERVDRSGS